MPTPTTVPTAEDKEVFSEITFVSSEDVLELVSDFTTQETVDEKWNRTLDDFGEWPDIDAKATKKVLIQLGSLKWSDKERNPEEIRLEFRNKVRRRYGLEPFTSEMEGELSDQAISSLQWF